MEPLTRGCTWISYVIPNYGLSTMISSTWTFSTIDVSESKMVNSKSAAGNNPANHSASEWGRYNIYGQWYTWSRMATIACDRKEKSVKTETSTKPDLEIENKLRTVRGIRELYVKCLYWVEFDICIGEFRRPVQICSTARSNDDFWSGCNAWISLRG